MHLLCFISCLGSLLVCNWNTFSRTDHWRQLRGWISRKYLNQINTFLDMRAVKKMSSIVYSCLNFLQHGIITQGISPKNNYTIWKIPVLIPLNFSIVRRLPILFIYKLNRLFIAKSCRYLFSYARTIRFYSQTFALVFYEFGISSHPLPSF